MPVGNFVDDPVPDDLTVPILRYVEFWKFKDLIDTGELYFRRADLLNDENEGLPPSEYERVLKLSKYDFGDIRKRDHSIGSLAQFRQSFYVNCWHLYSEETALMWRRYGKDGLAIVSRYDLLMKVLNKLPDKVLLGLVRYGSSHLIGWNVIRFITTKRRQHFREREVRAMIDLMGGDDSGNRHFDSENRPHDRPIYNPPASLPAFVRKSIDVSELIEEVILSPFAPPDRFFEVEGLLGRAGIDVRVKRSRLTAGSQFIPTEEELKKFGQ